MEDIGVTVCCIAYNHEKYIKKCLDGFINQKTSFKFEVLVHDDASTDRTAEIIQEYENKYPDIIKPIYQSQNQYSQGIYIQREILLPLARGKYFAICEGDDFWCNENKLQLQYEAMEAHPDVHFCIHRVSCIDESGRYSLGYLPPFNLKGGILYPDEYLNIVIDKNHIFQTSSFFRKTDDVKRFFSEAPEFLKVSDVGDVPALLYSGTLGNVYYIDSVLSCYRVQSVGSWNEKQKNNKQLRQEHTDTLILTFAAFNKYTNEKYSKQIMQMFDAIYFSQCLTEGGQEGAKTVLNKAPKEYWRKNSKKHRACVLFKAYFPWLLDFYHILSGRNRD